MKKYNITIVVLAIICLVSFIAQSIQEQARRETSISYREYNIK